MKTEKVGELGLESKEIRRTMNEYIDVFKWLQEEADYWRHFQKREALDVEDVLDVEDGETKVVFARNKLILADVVFTSHISISHKVMFSLTPHILLLVKYLDVGSVQLPCPCQGHGSCTDPSILQVTICVALN